MQSSNQSCPKCARAEARSGIGCNGGTVLPGNSRMECIVCGARLRVAHRSLVPGGDNGIGGGTGRRTAPVDMSPEFAGTGPLRLARAISIPAPDGFLLLTLAIMAGFLLLQPFSASWRFTLPWHMPPGIEISAIKTDQLQQNGKPTLRVEGRITNNDSVRREIGDVTIVLKQSAGHAVYSWKHRPALEYLDPGQSIRFTSSSETIPDFASQVEVSAAGHVAAAGLINGTTAQW